MLDDSPHRYISRYRAYRLRNPDSLSATMASKKKNHPTKVCRIWQWIEGHDEQFAGLIRNLCMEGALAPGFAGVTFLYPEDKAYRDSIIDADGDEAVKMVQSLI